jgi:hypothetical protein
MAISRGAAGRDRKDASSPSSGEKRRLASQPSGSAAESRRLTRALKAYPDNPDALLDLMEQHMDKLNYINIVAALKW